MKQQLRALVRALPVILAFSLPVPAMAQSTPAPTTVDLAAEAQRRAPNDLATASAYFEAGGPDAATVATEVNRTIAKALEVARGFPSVAARSGNVSSYPVYAQPGTPTVRGQGDVAIEGWRMRAELQLESRDIAAMSDLLGKLQATLAVGSLNMQPAPETRAAVADQAATDAIHAFQARAKSIAATLGKQYRIRHLSINHSGGHMPVQPMMRAMAMSADAASAPMPIASGDSEVTVTVSGTIELLDQ